MFDGTDLSAAYGYDAAPMATPVQHIPPPGLMANPPPPPASALEAPKSTAPHVMPPEVSYAPPPQMYAHQSARAGPAGDEAGDGFFDRLARKKWEVLKLVVFSLIILLALSVDHVAMHYLSGYIGASFLTATQELLVRLSYPVAIVLIMWIIKASL